MPWSTCLRLIEKKKQSAGLHTSPPPQLSQRGTCFVNRAAPYSAILRERYNAGTLKGSSKHLILVSLFFTLRSKADLDLGSLCERAPREHFASTPDDN